MKALEKILSETDFFSSMDIHFSRFISRLAKDDSPELALAAALLCRATSAGNICLDLAKLAGETLQPNEQTKTESTVPELICPDLATWLAILQKSGVVGEPGTFMPLVLDHRTRLYLFRYWEYENIVAEYLRNQDRYLTNDIDQQLLADGVRRFFPATSEKTDWQMIATLTAVLRPFCVISGGPGTGKTSIVAKIIALLLEQANDKKTLDIQLAAPTGKAAARLQDAIRRQKEKLPVTKTILDKIPDKAATLHRMLGSIAGSPYFRHHVDNLLAADVVIVDEASMVDLPLLAKLVTAIRPDARLIMLGDRHQLSSVEPGAVLADICHPDFLHLFSDTFNDQLSQITGSVNNGLDLLPPDARSPGLKSCSLQDSLVELQQTHRFAPGSGIQKLSTAVKLGRADEVFAILNDQSINDVSWLEIPGQKKMELLLREKSVPLLNGLSQADSPAAGLASLDSFRVLCALRRGPYGTIAVNNFLEKIFTGHADGKSEQKNYQGQPLMITRNDYALQLYNGDVGIVLPDHDADNSLRVFFQDQSGDFRNLHPLRLPPHETVFALTVHKSQGSEFDNVLLILPDVYSPVLARELIYTAVSRARQKVEIWSGKELLIAALSAHTNRDSGLHDAIWDN